VIGAQCAAGLTGEDRVVRTAQGFDAYAFFFQIADRQRIEDRGDTGGDDLRIMGKYGRQRRPEHPGARHQVLFQIVGVQLDQARNHVVAVAVDSTGCLRRPFVDEPDKTIPGNKCAMDDAIVEHDAGVGQNEIIHKKADELRLGDLEGAHRKQTGGDAVAHVLVVEDAKHRGARSARFLQQIGDNGAIVGI